MFGSILRTLTSRKVSRIAIYYLSLKDIIYLGKMFYFISEAKIVHESYKWLPMVMILKLLLLPNTTDNTFSLHDGLENFLIC